MAKLPEPHSLLRVRIVCDDLYGPRVYDRDGNEILKGCIRSVRWEWTVGDRVPRVRITTLPAALDASAEIEELVGDLETQEAREQ